ncbi:sel1 repeat family protein [Methylolobus aquaticus]|nr:sel1 repeat family protein [Methylolobus aquaticus]
MTHRFSGLLRGLLLLAALAPTRWAAAGDDHPGLTEADQAYSSGDFERAAALYRRDAELGIVAAQLNLAFLFLDGQGVPADPTQAVLWFRRAAEQGNPEAQQNLGTLYREGRGVERSVVEAAKWYRLAGAQTDAAAVEKALTPEQKAEVTRLVADWKSRSGAPGRH